MLLLLVGLGPGIRAAVAEDGDFDEKRSPGSAYGDRTSQSLLFIPLLPLERQSEEAARELTKLLMVSLEDMTHLDVKRLRDVPPIFETEAGLYMAGCPPDEELGCQLVLGEKIGVDRVVSGTLVQDDGVSSVAITILNIPLAELEYSFEVRLRVGEEQALFEALELTLEELADPFDENVVVDESALAEAELERRREQKERSAMRALDLALPDTAYEPLESSRRVTRRRTITESDLEDQEDAELVSTDWEDVGLTKAQYVRWHNSRFAIDEWKTRAANHFGQPIVGLSLGYLFGPIELDYDAAWLQDRQTAAVIDSRSTLQPKRGGGFTAAVTLGFGITPFMDFEFCGSMSFSRLWLHLQQYETSEDDPNDIVKDPLPIEDGSQIRLWGMAWKLRLYPYAIWRVKPTLAGGFGVLLFPDLNNGDRYPDFQAGYYYVPEVPYNDQMVIIEPGMIIELSKHAAITADLTIAFSVRPEEARVFTVDHYSNESTLDELVDPPFLPKPGYIGIRVGVQARFFRPRFPEIGGKDYVNDGL